MCFMVYLRSVSNRDSLSPIRKKQDKAIKECDLLLPQAEAQISNNQTRISSQNRRSLKLCND